MIVRTESSKSILDFLNQDPIINLNIIGAIENILEAEIYVDNKENPTGVFVRNGYMHYIYSKEDSFINEVLATFMKDGFYGFSGVEASIAKKIRSKYISNWESCCTLYYMPGENLDMSLIKNTAATIDIKDAETIDKYYQFRNSTSLARVQDDITRRPSSAVYVDGDIACWVLVHEDDSMGIMYTKEEYRRRGYAVDVTVDLASKIINSGKIPFLQIIKNNNMSPGLAKKCGFIECGHVEWFGIIAGIPDELVEICDSCREKFLHDMDDEFKKSIIINELTSTKMFTFLSDDLLDRCKAINGFTLRETLDENSVDDWCDVVCRSYGIPENETEYYKTGFKKALAGNESDFRIFTGFLNGIPVSTSVLLQVDDDLFGIFLIAVLPEYRRQGIGTMTSVMSMNAARNSGFELVLAEPPKQYAGLFEKLGFKSIIR